ncbi:MAG: cytochrome c3 family protein [Phycisphaerae bacterium]|nr:cytochrome c3 family protein [Phycisphaerae bacterium]
MSDSEKPYLHFPKWANKVPVIVATVGGLLTVYVIVLLGYGANARTLNVGYAPVQPVPFSHELHAGLLGINCEYCHTDVKRAGYAALPPTQTCMNCHAEIAPKSKKLAWIHKSYATGLPVPWIKVNDEPDYVYFNHAAHVNAGISCLTCHGHINEMTRVYQAKPLNMAWCLACHRDPAPHLRPRNEVTNLQWTPNNKARLAHDLNLTVATLPKNLGQYLMKRYKIPSTKLLTDCETCHR